MKRIATISKALASQVVTASVSSVVIDVRSAKIIQVQVTVSASSGLSTATIGLSYSLDGSLFTPVTTATAISANGVTQFPAIVDPGYCYLRVDSTTAAGTMTVLPFVVIKEDQ